MTSIPHTPNEKPALEPPSISKTDDRSDDDSDAVRDGEASQAKDDRLPDPDNTFTEEADTNYSLFTNPPDLARTRQQLFEAKDEFELTAQDFEDYFPFVDNVWRKYKQEQRENEPNTEIFCCRLRPSNQHKSSTPRPPVEGRQQRRKRKREEKTCPMLLKVTYCASPVKKVKISKAVSADVTHTHDLEYMDQNKRNSAVMDVARREAIRGFLPGSIFWKMQDEPDKMDEAGGKHMKVSDVRNVQYPWRQQNATAILKAHAGYSQQRTGPRQPRATASSTPATPQNGPPRPQPHVQTFAPHPPQPPPLAQQPYQPLPPGTLNYPEHAKEFLRPFLPSIPRVTALARPHITLTWATSLDSRIALLPGVQTPISGPETKAMTHFLRSQHDAILIGVNTAQSDDPGLNCRLTGAGGYGGQDRAMQPRPIIVDPRARLHIHPNMRLLKAAAEGKALGPWIVVGPGIKLHPTAVTTLKSHGGEFLQINEIHPEHGLDWQALFSIFHREGIRSVMIEGGGKVLSELLKPRYSNLVDSIIITIAPTFFGTTGVQVSPETAYDGGQPIQTRLTNVKWQPMGQSDMVLCGQLEQGRYQQRLPGIQEFSRQAGVPPHQAFPNPPHQPPNQAQSQVQGQGQVQPQTQPQPQSQIQSQIQVQTQAQQRSPVPPPQIHPAPPPHTPQSNGTPVPAPGPAPVLVPAPTPAPPPHGKSPKFRHYGAPGPLR